MHKKAFHLALACLFLFILMKSSWHYCPPDPTLKLSIPTYTSAVKVFKKHKPPCAVLNDLYNLNSENEILDFPSGRSENPVANSSFQHNSSTTQ